MLKNLYLQDVIISSCICILVHAVLSIVKNLNVQDIIMFSFCSSMLRHAVVSIVKNLKVQGMS